MNLFTIGHLQNLNHQSIFGICAHYIVKVFMILTKFRHIVINFTSV
jgi:hypothetical protein